MKHLPRFIAAGIALLAAAPAPAQTFPDRPVRVIVPYVAGQGVDLTARLVTEKLTKELGQPFPIENKPGAGANLGTQYVKQAAADGHTLLACTNATHAANKALYPNLPFDPEADFEPVAMLVMMPMNLTVAGDSPFNSLADLLAAARAKPDSINVALPHTTARVVFELLRSEAKAPLFPVPYKGLPLGDLVSGRIQALVDTVAATRALITAGKLKALAVTTAQPTALLPGVRPVAQQGVPGFEIVAWTALCAPRGTPPAAIATLSRATQAVMAMPEVRERMGQMGLEPRPMGPEDLRQFMKSETRKWGDVIRAAKITAE